jgi:hypothetical protein
MLNVIMLNVIPLNFIMLNNVIMLSVVGLDSTATNRIDPVCYGVIQGAKASLLPYLLGGAKLIKLILVVVMLP